MEKRESDPLEAAAADLYAARARDLVEKHEAAKAAREKMNADVLKAIKAGALDDKRMGAAPYIADG